MVIAVFMLVFGAQLIAYGLISNALTARRLQRQRVAGLVSRTYAEHVAPARNRPGVN